MSGNADEDVPETQPGAGFGGAGAGIGGSGSGVGGGNGPNGAGAGGAGVGDPSQIVSKALLCFNDKYVSTISTNWFFFHLFLGEAWREVFNKLEYS